MKRLLELLSESNLPCAKLEALLARPKDTPFSADEQALITKIKKFEEELIAAFAVPNVNTISDVLALLPTDVAAYPKKCLSKLRLIQDCLQKSSLSNFELFYKAVYKKFIAKVFQGYLHVVDNHPADSVTVREKTNSLLESLRVLAGRKDNKTESSNIPNSVRFSNLIHEHLPISSEVYASKDLLAKLNYIQTSVVPKTNLHERIFADFIAQVTTKKGEADDLSSAYSDVAAAFNNGNFNAAIPALLKFASVVEKQHVGLHTEAILKSLAQNATYKCYELPNLLIYAAIHKFHSHLPESHIVIADRQQLGKVRKALQYLQFLLGDARVEEKAAQVSVNVGSEQKAKIVLTTETQKAAHFEKQAKKDEIEPIESRNKSTIENPRGRFSDRKSEMIDFLNHLKSLDKEKLTIFLAGQINCDNFNEIIKFIQKSYAYLSSLAPTFSDLAQETTWESLLPSDSSLVNSDLLEKLYLIQNISVKFSIELKYPNFYNYATHHLSLTSKDDRNLDELTHAVENKLGLAGRVKNTAKQQLPVEVLPFSDIPTLTSVLPSKNATRHIPISELEQAANDFTQKTLAKRAILNKAKQAFSAGQLNEETDLQLSRNNKEISLIHRIKSQINVIKSLTPPESDKDLLTQFREPQPLAASELDGIKTEKIAALLAVFDLDLKAIEHDEKSSQAYIDAYLNLYAAFADVIPNLTVYSGLLNIFATLKQNNVDAILKAFVEFGKLMTDDFCERNARFLEKFSQASKRWPIKSLELHAAIRTAIANIKTEEMSEDEAETVNLMERGFMRFEQFAEPNEVVKSKKIDADEPQVKMVLDCARNNVLPEQKLHAILAANNDCKHYLGNFIANRIGELGGSTQNAMVVHEGVKIAIPVQAVVASTFDVTTSEDFKFADNQLTERREEIRKLVEKDSTLYVAIKKYNAVLALDDTLKSDKSVREKLDTYSARFKAKEPLLNKKMDSDDTLWTRLMNKLRNLVSSIAPKYVEAPVTVKEANLVAKMQHAHTSLFCRRQDAASPRSPMHSAPQRSRAH